MENQQSVTFKLEAEDLKAYATFLARPRTSVTRIVPRLLGGMALGLVISFVVSTIFFPGALSADLRKPGMPFIIAAQLLIIFGIIVFVTRLQLQFAFRRQTKSPGNAALLNQVVNVTITPQFFSWVDEGLAVRIIWRRIRAVAGDTAHVYVFANDVSAFIIPKRAFADEARAQRFFETAHGYWREARGTPPPIPHPGGE